MSDFFWSTQNPNGQDVRCEGGEVVHVDPKSIGAIAADAGNFVYRPGGVPGGAVFTTWPTLAAAVAAVDPALAKTISVDDSIAAAHATAGSWPGFENVTWQSGGADASSQGLATLIFDTGARLPGVEHFNAIGITFNFNDATGTVIPSTTANLVCNWNGVNTASAGGQGLATLGAGFTLSLRAFASALAANLFKGSATSTYALLLFSGSSLSTNTVNGTAGGGVIVIADGSSQDGVAGTTQTPAATVEILDPMSTFVFRPGGVAGGNVFTTWVSLYAAYSLTPGARNIYVDDSLAAAHVTSGTWNVDKTTFVGIFANSETLIFDDGAKFVFDAIWLDNGIVFQSDSTSAVATSGLVYIEGDGSSIQSAAAPAVPWGRISSDFALTVFARDGAVIGDGTHNAFTVDAAHSANLFTQDASNIRAHGYGGLGTLDIAVSPAATIGAQDTSTVVKTFNGLSSQVAYTAAAAGNWNPAPPLVNAALDQLAAPNTVQQAGNTGTGTGTVSTTTGNIAKKRSGQVNVSGVATGLASAGTTITVSLFRDGSGGTLIRQLPALTVLTTVSFSVPIAVIDTLPDTANHTYTCQVVATAGNITTGTNGIEVRAIEL